jgi:hypothetical protein
MRVLFHECDPLGRTPLPRDNMRKYRPFILLWVVSLACGGSDGATGTEPTVERFTTTLSAANVVGANIDSPGTGTATFEWDGTRLTFVATVQNMNQVIAAHIHGPASASENANIVLDIFIPAAPTGPVNGELAKNAVVAGSHLLVGGATLEQVVTLLRTGQSYLLVHTSANPDGEIRGQMQVD